MQALRKTIEEGNCVLNLEERSIEGIIRSAVKFLVQTGKLTDDQSKDVIDGLIQREREAPTVIGNAVAIPHFYGPVLDQPLMLFIRLRHAVNLGAPDGIATRFIFLLISPEQSTTRHLDALAAVARLMSDDEFHYEAASASTQQDLLDALDRHVQRSRPSITTKPSAPPEELAKGTFPFAGLLQDVRRRLPHYVDDFREGLQAKCISSILFLFFACLAPAVTFGGIMGLATDGQIGPVEMLTASAVCGVIFALFAGQPLIILGGIGPLLIFTIILYRLCGDLGFSEQFLSVYGWVGLWTGLFTVLLAITNASNLMRYFTRFTDEIFSALMSLIFIYEAIKALANVFHDSFGKSEPHDAAFLTLILTIGTFYIAMSLSRFRRSHYLLPRMREFLSDFGPTIALAAMALVAWLLRNEVTLTTLSVEEGFKAPNLIDLWVVPTWVRWAAAGPAFLATLLVYLSHNITARLVNSPENKLRKGAAYHLDLLVVGGLIAACSMFGFPWLVAATVRSLAHVRALSDTEEVAMSSGASKERIIHITENRFTGLIIHILIGLSLFWLPVLELVPMATLYGIFLYMGFVSLIGNQFMERLSLWLMDSSLYPATHYIRRVPIRVIHLYTFLQFVCLGVLCVINVSRSETVRIIFPVFIALLVPVRALAARLFNKEHLAVLDADEVPEQEESHWV
ncbi:MAG: PTS sugar transporter subunit IIA [Pirellulaceae bacterium]|nr:PTS sugar transporter subunit IIA [Pirellulaceae bacterium]